MFYVCSSFGNISESGKVSLGRCERLLFMLIDVHAFVLALTRFCCFVHVCLTYILGVCEMRRSGSVPAHRRDDVTFKTPLWRHVTKDQKSPIPSPCSKISRCGQRLFIYEESHEWTSEQRRIKLACRDEHLIARRSP